MSPIKLKRYLAVATSLAAMVLIAACGGGAENGSGTEVEHKFGSTVVPDDPERVVTVGYNDHEFALALGIEPVAIRDWVGVGPVTEVPWAEERISEMGEEPELLSRNDLNVESIARLEPDLIIGIFGGVTERQYDTLSRIAPTVVAPADYVDFGVPWQEQLTLTGEALGRQGKAKEVLADLESRFARAREQNPEFEGASGLVPYAFDPGVYGAYASEDLRSRFLTELGFEIPGEIDELAGDEFYAEFSNERFRLMDQDVVLMYGAPRSKRDEVTSDSLFRRLDAVRDGRLVYMDNEDDLLGAIGLSTPYSLPYALDEAVPRLKAAVDGDPATEVEEVE